MSDTPGTTESTHDSSDEGDEVDVIPRLKRGRGIRFNPNELFRIATVAVLLVGILIMQRQCADSAAGFVTSFDEPDGESVIIRDDEERDGGVNLGELRMLTDEEIRQAFDNKGADKLLQRESDAGPGDSDASPPPSE